MTDEIGFREMIDRMCAEVIFRLGTAPRQSWYEMPEEHRAGWRKAMFAAYMVSRNFHDESGVSTDVQH